jgi:hypothetical protein
MVYPPGHPRAGEVIEFSIGVPGRYSLELECSARPPHLARYYVRYHVDIDEDGRPWLRLTEKSFPDGYDLTPLERELLDGLARIIARDVLRQRGGPQGRWPDRRLFSVDRS